jgi:NTE family protein
LINTKHIGSQCSRVVVVMAAVAFVSVATSAAAPADPDRDRPRVGLALSGGGARGIAHIGVLRALEEHEIAVDAIAGTSMGAVVGGLFASGYDSHELLEIVRSIDWQRIFSGEPDRRLVPLSRRLQETPPVFRIAYDLWDLKIPSSVLSDYRIQRTLTRHLTAPNLRAGRDFDRLPTPLRVVAADVRTGERVVLSEGSLGRAVRASMSIPLAFAPIRWNGHRLVDGGIADNLPVGVVRDMGADVVIAVDVSSPPQEGDDALDVLAVANQLTDLLISTRNVAYRVPADLTIRPELDSHSFTDYSNLEFLIEQGYQAALDSLETLSEWKRSSDMEPTRSAEDSLGERTVSAVTFRGNERVEDEIVALDFRVRPGQPFDLDRAIAEMDRVFATGFFESCWLEVTPAQDGQVQVVLNMEEAERRIAEVGLSYNEDDEARAFVRLNNSHLLRWGEQEQLTIHASDRANGMSLRLLRPRLLFSGVGLAIRVDVGEENPRYFRNDEFVTRAEFDHRSLSLTAHVPLGRIGLFRAGVRAENVSVREKSGLEFGPSVESLRVFQSSFHVDSLDDLYAPRRGSAFHLLLEKNVGGEDRTERYSRLRLRARTAVSFGSASALEGAMFLGISDRPLPVSQQFRLGGPQLAPGLRRDQLWGDEALSLALGYRFFVTRNLSLLLRGSAANAFPHEDGGISLDALRIGVGWGMHYQTPFGPIQIEYGVSEGNVRRLYFSAGFY